MTAQISDQIFYCNENYSIVAIENEWSFTPQSYGLKPVATSTACYRGYYTKYSVIDDYLLLNQLNIGLNETKLPPFNGVVARKSKYFKLNSFYEYSDVNLPINYSGGLIVGFDFLREFYVHMRFHRAHCYKQVYELIFDKGKLIESINHNKSMEEVRNNITTIKETNHDSIMTSDEINDFVSDSFSLKYDKKWKV